MAYIQGENREQLTLMPMCLDDYIEPNNICRVIATFVNNLDLLELGFKYAKTKTSGRPSYNPARMLMLYIYGYMNRIRSSRRLDAEARRNVEVMWLMEKLTPDDKTISNFRKDNAKALKNVFRIFNYWCNNNDLFGKELLAIDGTKIRANCSWKNIFTLDSANKGLEKINQNINRYMDDLASNDSTECEEEQPNSDAVAKVLENLNNKKVKLTELISELEKGEFNEISTVDPDARIMRQGGDARARDACYNVRTVVDSKYKLIVDFETSTCANDIATLSRPAKSAKEILGVNEISVVADSGFYDGADADRCKENNITCFIAKLKRGTKAPSEKYNHSNFKYDKINDTYTCPQEVILPFKYTKKVKELVRRIYGNIDACRACSCRDLCTSQKRGWREVQRNPHQDAEDEVDARMATLEGRRIMSERKKLVEHPYGTIKKIWGYGCFLCRGLEKTTGEASLILLAYNLRRVANIFTKNPIDLINMLT